MKSTTRIILALILVGLPLTSFSKTWEKGEIVTKIPEINPLKFRNRAGCAKESKKPADSVFLLLDNMSVAKSLYRLGRRVGADTSVLTKEGIWTYRTTVYQLIRLIHQKIVDKKLPLLPPTLERGKRTPEIYRLLSVECQGQQYCEKFDYYIKRLWEIGNQNLSFNERFDRFQEIDAFHKKRHFFQDKVIDRKHRKKPLNFRCLNLKKFSPLQGHLFGTKPNKEYFELLARSMVETEELFGSCDEQDFTSLKGSLTQWEIPNLKDRRWKKIGHAYWNTMKLYLSWAFRYAPEVEAMSGRFAPIFKSVMLEQSLLLVPNGCRSIVPAGCDNYSLGQASMRQFASKDFIQQAFQSDFLNSFPRGPQQDLIDNQIVGVNNDVLDLGSFESASEWYENFRDNVAGARTKLRKKINKAQNFFNLVYQKYDTEKLITDLKAYATEEVALAEDQQKHKYSELYYLCSEYGMATHPVLSFLKGKLELLKNDSLLSHLITTTSKTKTSVLYERHVELGEKVREFCGSLPQKEIWPDDFGLDRKGFQDWYLGQLDGGPLESDHDERRMNFYDSRVPYLAYSSYQTFQMPNDVICTNPVDCLRQHLRHVIGMYSGALYAQTFWANKREVNDANLTNPYAERVACKVYDPWFKTKQALFGMVSDVANAALSTFSLGLVYARADLVPGRVTSFNQLVEEGKIVFDPKVTKQKVTGQLTFDFGPLLGVPCAVSISGSPYNPYGYYQFSGISVGSCVDASNTTINVQSASDISDPRGANVKTCVECRINFESILGSFRAFTAQLGPYYFLFRGLVRLYRQLKDPHNVPRSWKPNFEYVFETYKRFGGIPKKCVKPLYRGNRCLSNRCEQRIVEAVKRAGYKSIKDIKITDHWYSHKVWVHDQEEPLEVTSSDRFDQNYNGECGRVSVRRRR